MSYPEQVGKQTDRHTTVASSSPKPSSHTGLLSKYTFPFTRLPPRKFLSTGLRLISPELINVQNVHVRKFGKLQIHSNHSVAHLYLFLKLVIRALWPWSIQSHLCLQADLQSTFSEQQRCSIPHPLLSCWFRS